MAKRKRRNNRGSRVITLSIILFLLFLFFKGIWNKTSLNQTSLKIQKPAIEQVRTINQPIEVGQWQIPIRRNGSYPILSSDDKDHADRCPIQHAWDFTAPYGTEIYPAMPGTVVITSCGNEHGYGCWIEVDHRSGIHTRYAHMISGSFKVSKGQTVNKDTVLGQVGWTGATEFGPHLHFEFLKDEVRQPTTDFFGSPEQIGIEYQWFASAESASSVSAGSGIAGARCGNGCIWSKLCAVPGGLVCVVKGSACTPCR